MKRSRLKRRTALKAKKALARGTARLKRGKRLRAKKRIKWANKERRARLEARDFGPKAIWIRGLPCEVTRHLADSGSVAAHVERTRGAGGHAEALVPHHPLVEVDWHQLVDAVWLEKYGRSKDDVRDAAELYEAEWQRMVADGRARPFIHQWEEATGLTWLPAPALPAPTQKAEEARR